MLQPYRFLYLQQKREQILHDLLLGMSYENSEFVYLPEGDRSAHVYICGVSGSGKSRFLENMLIQDIAKGHPVCLIDPTGSVYRKALEFIAYCVERAEEKGFRQDEVLPHYHFLDLSDADNPLRLNPLERQGDETTEHQVDDLLKTIERIVGGSLEEQRRLRNILRSAFWVIAELNRLLEDERPPFLRDHAFPLNLHYCYEFLLLADEQRLAIIEALPETHENRWPKAYWRNFAGGGKSQQHEIVQSSWNILQYLAGDSMVDRLFHTQSSTLHVAGMMEQGHSLFCYLPLGENLIGSQLVGTFLATKFQKSAYRRSLEERRKRYYLYIDEFHEFADIEYAKAAATLRQYGLSMVNAHQSQSQPPFHDMEGQALLQTIKANSQIKVLFRLDRPDAEQMAKEVFELTQRRLNFQYKERSETQSETRTTSIAYSFEQTKGTANTWSRSHSRALGQTATLGIGETKGTNIGKTLSQGSGTSVAERLGRSISETESRGITEAYSEQHGLSVAVGEGWSQLRDHKRGFQLTVGFNESHASQTGGGKTTSDQTSQTQTDGRTTGRTNTIGLPVVGAGVKESTATALSDQYSSAIGQIQGLSEQETWGETKTGGRKVDHGQNIVDGINFGTSGSLVKTTNEATRHDTGKKQEKSRGKTESADTSMTDNWQETLAQTFTLLDQISQTYSQALQQTDTHGDATGQSERNDLSKGISSSESSAVGTSLTKSERSVFYTLEGERELAVNQLQRLERQQCFIAKEALGAVHVVVPMVQDNHYAYLEENLPALILRKQRRRLQPAPTPQAIEVESHPGFVPFPDTFGEDDSPFED